MALANVNAQNSNLTLGGGTGELSINFMSTGYFTIHRGGVRQLYGSEPLFGVRIGTTNYSSIDASLTRGGDISVDRGSIQERTKVFSGVHNGSPFSLTVKMIYNKSNPNYLTIETIIDASNINSAEVISYGYGFDTFVNGCDKAAAYILPNINGYNGTSNSDVRFSTTDIQTLRIVGAKNNSAGTESTLIGLFPIGRPFDRAYSSYYSGYKANNVINPNSGTGGTNGNRFSFAAYDSFECPSTGGGNPWDNGIAGVYDNIPVNEKTTIRTGLSFTEDLDGELDYFWNGNKNLVANLGENINLNLSYTSYNPNAITGIGFRIDLPGLKVRNGGFYSGFSSGNFNYTTGNEYFQLTNGGIAGLATGNITVPVEITQCGQWSIDANATSNMLRALPLGSPAILTVKSTVGLESTTAVNVCKGTGHSFTVKLPEGVTAAQDFVVNLTYTGATSNFETLPMTVNIPANQNSATFTIASLPNAADNASLDISLASTNKEFVTIGTANSTTISVFPAVVAGNITGNNYVCVNMTPLQINGTQSTGGSGNFGYLWQYKTETGNWTDISNAIGQNYTPAALTENTSFRRVTTDDHCDEFKYYSNEFLIKVVATPTDLYWNPNAADNNWNNPLNWLDALTGGMSLGMVPLACTDVFITNVNTNAKYPSLDNNNTPTDVYGPPVCKDITFAYGSELAFQHILQYEKAFVRYNWGYYDPIPNGMPNNIYEGSQKLNRNQWHILAAPLKSMASGDFSLAGHPFSWQRQFNVSSANSIQIGDFDKPFAANGIPLVENNNAIAIRMEAYQNQTGYRQDNLDGLKGILEFPYFENTTALPHYTAHHYDAIAKRSYFYYYDTKTLKLINSPLSSMKRAEEAYRFIYETENKGLPLGNVYVMPIQASGSGNEVMVGNPFLAGIDAASFASANSSKIDASQGYKLLSDDGSSWIQMPFTSGNLIPAWKAFIITLQSSTSSLSFPLTASHTRMASIPVPTRAADGSGLKSNTLYIQALKGGTKSGDQAELRYNVSTGGESITKMVMPEGHATPEVFFIDPDKAIANLVQPLAPGQNEIGIGVKTSDVKSRLSLEFLNIPAFSASTGMSVVLLDKHLNTMQDLSRDPVYHFTQQTSGLDNQYVDKNRFALQLGIENGINGSKDVRNSIQITYLSGVLKIISDENIETVAVYDVNGHLAFVSHSVGQPQFNQPVALQGKLFLVQVKTASGKVNVKKIIGS